MSVAGSRDRRAVAGALKPVHTAARAARHRPEPAAPEESDLAARSPAIAPSRRKARTEAIPGLNRPPEMRRPISTGT